MAYIPNSQFLEHLRSVNDRVLDRVRSESAFVTDFLDRELLPTPAEMSLS